MMSKGAGDVSGGCIILKEKIAHTLHFCFVDCHRQDGPQSNKKL
jgi:hypothetical protein